MGDENDSNNIVTFDKNRKRLREAPGKSNGKGPGAGKSNGQHRSGANGDSARYEKAIQAQKGKGSLPASNIRWFHYLQVVLLLLLVAWLMRSCQI
ncbi:MAG: hypothetical protein NTV34_12430 [Proteobacteria bacterium]|nr:hypothetical protein [Pseudomonadota bacterium]